jgi:hypothetical protein
MFAKLLYLNQFYGKLVVTALAQPRTSSKWYNILPTSAKRQMDMFQREWKAFNLGVVRSAREASAKAKLPTLMILPELTALKNCSGTSPAPLSGSTGASTMPTR